MAARCTGHWNKSYSKWREAKLGPHMPLLKELHHLYFVKAEGWLMMIGLSHSRHLQMDESTAPDAYKDRRESRAKLKELKVQVEAIVP